MFRGRDNVFLIGGWAKWGDVNVNLFERSKSASNSARLSYGRKGSLEGDRPRAAISLSRRLCVVGWVSVLWRLGGEGGPSSESEFPAVLLGGTDEMDLLLNRQTVGIVLLFRGVVCWRWSYCRLNLVWEYAIFGLPNSRWLGSRSWEL